MTTTVGLQSDMSSLQVDLTSMSQQELVDFEKVLNRVDAVNEVEANRIRRLKSSAMSFDNVLPPAATVNPRALLKLQCRSCGALCLPPAISGLKSSAVRSALLCRVCQMPVCPSCSRSVMEPRLSLCTGCHRKLVLDAKTGNWFHQQIKKRLSMDTVTVSLPTGPHARNEVPATPSPKKKILHRLRSYSSVHEELDDIASSPNFLSEASRYRWAALQDSAQNCHKRSLNSPSYYTASEHESEEEMRVDLSDDTVNSNRNFYRPLSHISNQPLKSCSNGSPVAVDDSMTDICKFSGDASDINPDFAFGEVLLELDFNFRMSQLVIILRQCRNLPAVDGIGNAICPYLFVLLLPDRSKKSRRTTSVKKSSFFPTFDQIFKYSINFNELESRSVLVMLCHKHDLSCRDMALGQVVIPLAFMDFSRPVVRWYSFQSLLEANVNQPRFERTFSSNHSRYSNIPSYFGEISLAIKHVPRNGSSNVAGADQVGCTNGELHVWVKSMRNIAQHQLSSVVSVNSPFRRLSTLDDKGVPDSRLMDNISFSSNKILSAVAQLGQNQPVAKVCLLPYRTGVQCTSPAKAQSDNSSQFVWSTILKFMNIDSEELRTRSLEVTIWVNSRHGWLNRIIHPRCVGGVRLCRGGSAEKEFESGPHQGLTKCSGPSTGLIEEKMWLAMIDRTNTWVDGTIKLKMDSTFFNMNFPDTP